jgi:(1->4)-alpha-D-glucan 1-alpha-D-glucosylmutase
MRKPASTYRLQIRESLTLADAAGLVGYLRRLGADWVYLSPILQAEKGSDHGYDVTDPSRVDASRGGPEGLKALAYAAHEAGLGVLVDIVPNHQGVATPADNPWWWSLLKDGPGSRYAEAFDVDWAAAGGRLRLPVLGDGQDELEQLRIEDGELRYYDHRFPLAAGTYDDAASPRQIHDRQHYELVSWRRADAELNYRRFFGVNTLAGVRVEVPWVFDESHAEIRRWFDEGLVDGLRVDHPDGLADPKDYLDSLRALTGGAYVLVEKILEPGERLPGTWACAGTTGYDLLADLDRLFVDPAGQQALEELAEAPDYYAMIHGTKRAIADGMLHSEVQRLVRLVPPSAGLETAAAADAVAELLACFPVYRSYLPDGAEYLEEAVRAAAESRPDLVPVLDVLKPLLLAAGTELSARFQQTSGMVMAKGVEDTAFYRYARLTSLNEVGADPSIFSLTPGQLHAKLAERQRQLPLSMTTLTTHDTKRSEDTRARIHVLSEAASEWAGTFAQLRALAPLDDVPFAALMWQALVGAWPLERERAHAYAEKAAREAASSTTWTNQNEDFERTMHEAVDAAYDDPQVRRVLDDFTALIRSAGWSNSLSAKLLQLTLPGVPDVYQGTEFWDHSLVDPDNRRRVDFAARQAVLERIDGGEQPEPGPDGTAKLLVTTRALRLRRDRPELFTGYESVRAEGPAAEHLFGFDRGGAVSLATRLPYGLAQRGGWEDTAVLLPAGSYRDELTGRTWIAGNDAGQARGGLPVADILDIYPVALLVREDAAPATEASTTTGKAHTA